MKFRIKHVEGRGYFAQVWVPRWFGLSGRWMRIHHTIYGFDLRDDEDHPKELKATVKCTINAYYEHQQRLNNRKETYEPYTPVGE